jgi:type IV secretion system protein VirB9
VSAPLAAAVLLMLLAQPAAAEVRPQPGPRDPRIQSVLYDPDEVVLLEVSPGYQLAVQFAPDERIENVAVGDGTAWQVTPNKRGDHLFIKPVQGDVTTDMVVVTDARVYAFTLSPLQAPHPRMAYTVSFRYLEPAQATEVARAPAAPARWKLGGARALRPSRIDDDGQRVYLAWPAEQTLPAVFVADDEGNEASINGMVRDGVLVIDSLPARLVFRLDKRRATAIRVPAGSR